MPRPSLPSDTISAAVRRHFGLEQQELAAYLRVGRSTIANVEAGRREFSAKVLLRLLPLVQQLPPAPLPAPTLAELPADAPAPLAADLEHRRAECLHRAVRLRRELAEVSRQAGHALRWQATMPALLAALPLPPEGLAPANEEQYRALRTRQWLQRRASALTPADVTQYHLLRLQAEALETEAAALAALLPLTG
jgi:transcriptional regulator with XRE-family HTH domain